MGKKSDKPTFKVSIEGLEGFDPLGLKSVAEVSKEVIEFGIEGAKEFLKLTCKPLLEEFGLIARDQYTNWKLQNIIKMLEKAKGKLKYDLETGKLVIDPRVAYQIVEHASIVSNETLQDMWAGLFASSCHEYEEDENILFIDILKRLTSSQVKLINYLCTRAEKKFDMGKLLEVEASGLIYASVVKLCHKDLFSTMETGSELKVETELTSLINIGLITHTQNTTPPIFFRQHKAGVAGGLIPTVMALRLYVKCQGSVETPFTYFLDEIIHNYYNQIKDVISVKKENVLNFLYENHAIAQTYTDFLEFGINRAHPKTRQIYNEAAIVLKDETWLSLSDDELNNRLRPCIIYRYLFDIGKVYPIIYLNQPIGTFSYQEGIRR